jgi:hypothetical protein
MRLALVEPVSNESIPSIEGCRYPYSKNARLISGYSYQVFHLIHPVIIPCLTIKGNNFQLSENTIATTKTKAKTAKR